MQASNPGQLSALLVITLCCSAAAARAEFSLVESFDDLSPGNIHGQNGWVAAGTSSQVVADPANPDNQVLEITTESTTLHKDLLIPNGTVRTLFFRFRYANQLNYSFGMSDVASPDQFGHFESELSMSNATNELRIRDANNYDVLTPLTGHAWYNTWMLINNLGNNTQVYLHARPGELAGLGDRLDAEGQTVFDFRGSAGDLLTFFIKTGGGNSVNSGPLYIDDIYVEDTHALNLRNPTAESAPAVPVVFEATLALTAILVAATGAIILRKRRLT